MHMKFTTSKIIGQYCFQQSYHHDKRHQMCQTLWVGSDGFLYFYRIYKNIKNNLSDFGGNGLVKMYINICVIELCNCQHESYILCYCMYDATAHFYCVSEKSSQNYSELFVLDLRKSRFKWAVKFEARATLWLPRGYVKCSALNQRNTKTHSFPNRTLEMKSIGKLIGGRVGKGRRRNQNFSYTKIELCTCSYMEFLKIY